MLCTLHLEEKVLSKAGDGPGAKDDRKQLYWIAAKTCSKDHVTRILETIECRHPNAYIHLTNRSYKGKDGKEKRGVPLENWTNSHCSGRNWGKISSQASESSNSVGLKFRKMPPSLMVWELSMYIEEKIIKLAEGFQNNK